MEKVKVNDVKFPVASDYSELPEHDAVIDEKMKEEKDLVENNVIPYLTQFLRLPVEQLSTHFSHGKFVMDTNTKPAYAHDNAKPAYAYAHDNAKPAYTRENTKPAYTRENAKPAYTREIAMPAYSTHIQTQTPAQVLTQTKTITPNLPNPAEKVTVEFATNVTDEITMGSKSEARDALPQGVMTVAGALQGIRAKHGNNDVRQARAMEQSLSLTQQDAAVSSSTQVSGGETKVTYTFRRLDVSNQHTVELTLNKESLSQALVITPSTREVRERLEIARDAPGAPVFSLRDEGEHQKDHRGGAWHSSEEEDA